MKENDTYLKYGILDFLHQLCFVLIHRQHFHGLFWTLAISVSSMFHGFLSICGDNLFMISLMGFGHKDIESWESLKKD
jgi:hypothetical protein